MNCYLVLCTMVALCLLTILTWGIRNARKRHVPPEDWDNDEAT